MPEWTKRRRPDILLGDRGYDHDKYRRLVWVQGVKPVIARRGIAHGSGLGIHRWVVERTIAWLRGFRRLRIRWERRDDIHEAFLGLATCLTTHRHVKRLCQDLRGALGWLLRRHGRPRMPRRKAAATAAARSRTASLS
ncbi:Transposase DDE domain-containing protein [Streptomyces sp. MnatMP-M77]|nr:Transposase DDE domain-containing protein [Streptomyces sp. MnatMP-M77]